MIQAFQAYNSDTPPPWNRDSGFARSSRVALGFLILYAIFFVISFNLGYATLNRFNPGIISDLSDAKQYRLLVTEGVDAAESHWRFRVLLPYIAKPIYHLTKGHLGSWDPVSFSMLMVSSVFVALTAILIVTLGTAITGDWRASLVSALLYLSNFTVINGHLAGLVDSGEDAMMLVLWCVVIHKRLFWLPLIAAIGALAKETFVPFGTVFAARFLVSEQLERRSFQVRPFFCVLGMASSGILTVCALQSYVSSSVVTPLNLVLNERSGAAVTLAFRNIVIDRGFWYVFLVPLALGLWRLRELPRPLVHAAHGSAATALALGIWNNSGGCGAARAAFASYGPLLCISAASLLVSPPAWFNCVLLGKQDLRHSFRPTASSRDSASE